MTKEARLHNVENAVSLSDVGKTGQIHIKKNEIRSFFDSIPISDSL